MTPLTTKYICNDHDNNNIFSDSIQTQCIIVYIVYLQFDFPVTYFIGIIPHTLACQDVLFASLSLRYYFVLFSLQKHRSSKNRMLLLSKLFPDFILAIIKRLVFLGSVMDFLFQCE